MFSKFWHGTRNPFEVVCDRAGYHSLGYGPKCSQTIRLQNFSINHICRTNQWNSLIFYMLIPIHINWKLMRWMMGETSWLQGFKIGYISRMNWWNELIFCMLLQIHAVVISMILGCMWSKMDAAIYFMKPQNLLNVFMNWNDFLQADCDAIIFGRSNIISISLTFKCQLTAVLLVRPLTGRMLWYSVCPFLPPGICLGVFLKLDH